MSVIIPNSWKNQKPPPGSKIDWSHPLVRGMTHCLLLNEGSGKSAQDLVNNNTFSSNTTGTTGHFNGLGWNRTVASKYNYPLVGKAIKETYSEITVISKCRSLVSAETTCGPLAQYDYSIPKRSWLFYIVSTKITFNVCSTNAYTGNNGCISHQVFTNGIDYTIEGYWKAGGRVKGRVNGIPMTESADVVASCSDCPNLLVGCYTQGYDNDAFQFVGLIQYGYIWNRVLSESERNELYTAPYQFILPPVYRRYFPAVAASGTTEVTSNVSTTWNVRQAVESTHSTTWNVLEIVGNSQSTTWNVAANQSVIIAPYVRVPAKWNQKPPPGSQVDWSNPLSRELKVELLFNEGSGQYVNNLANAKSPCKLFNGWTWPNGYAVSNSALSAYGMLSNIPYNSSKGTTVYFEGYKVDELASRIVRIPDGLTLRISANRVQISGDDLVNNSQSSDFLQTFQTFRVVATLSDITTSLILMYVLVNSKLYTYSRIKPIISISGIPFIYLSSYSNQPTFANIGYNSLAIWNRTLSSNEALGLLYNPYTHILPPFYRRYFPAVEVSGTTEVTGSVSTTWNVRSAATASQSTTWNVRSAIESSLETTWNAQTSVSSELDTTWNVRSALTGSALITWNLRSSVDASELTTWNVRFAVASTLDTTWNVRTVITGSRWTRWHVESYRHMIPPISFRDPHNMISNFSAGLLTSNFHN